MTLRTTFLWLMIASLSFAAMLGIIAIVAPGFIRVDEEILVTSLTLALYSLPSLACAIVIGKRRFVPAMWLGVMCSPLAWLTWQPLIWDLGGWSSGRAQEDVLIKSAFTLTFVAIWSAHYGMLGLLQLDRAWFRRARVATLVIVGVLAAAGIAAIWPEYEEDWFLRALSVMGILGGCGTIILPIFALLDLIKRKTSRESIPTNVCVELVCPRCGREQAMPAGVGHCTECGLRIEIHVEEPRCHCGYLLFNLKGDACPECGREIPASRRWPVSKESGRLTD